MSRTPRARVRNRAPYLLAGVFVAGVILAAWLTRGRIQPVVSGYPAPGFEVTDAEGNPVTLEDFRGKVVLLNVWATWCAPCREEMPSMQRLYDRFSRDDFEIAAISIDAPAGSVDSSGNVGGEPVAFARDLALTFPVLLDPSGGIQHLYQTSGVPESFVIGPDGVIYKKVAGPTAWDSESNIALVRRLAGAR